MHMQRPRGPYFKIIHTMWCMRLTLAAIIVIVLFQEWFKIFEWNETNHLINNKMIVYLKTLLNSNKMIRKTLLNSNRMGPIVFLARNCISWHVYVWNYMAARSRQTFFFMINGTKEKNKLVKLPVFRHYS
jgi:hypothetical protein